MQDPVTSQPALDKVEATVGPEGRMPVERELKFVVDPDAFRRAQALDWLAGDKTQTRRLTSVYFDSASGALRAERVSLRLRRVRRGFTLTAKFPSPLGLAGDRGEVEVFQRMPFPELALLGTQAAQRLADILDGEPLVPVFTTQVRRQTRLVETGRASVEVAFDVGSVTAGDKVRRLREIELELKAGDPAELYRLGAALAAAVPARLSVLSKAAQGALLLSDEPLKAVRAQPFSLGAESSVDDAVAALIGGCLGHFTANWTVFDHGDAVGAVHQMRVALRRLRALLALILRVLPAPELAHLRGEAKRLATAMGEARDWDVFDATLADGPRDAFPDEPGFAVLAERVAERRAVGHAVVREILADPAATHFVLAAEDCVMRRGWRGAVEAATLQELGAPAREFADACLERLDRKVRKQGRRLTDLPVDARHEVRIALKNLRYATEAFAPLYGRGAVGRFARRATDLQEQLGHGNDAAVAQGLVQALDDGGDPAVARAVGITLGWLAGRAGAGDETLARLWRRYRKAERFWRDEDG